MKEKLRKMFLEMLSRQLNGEHGLSTRTNLFMIEVIMVEYLLEIFTGFNSEDSNLCYDEFHDAIVQFVDEMHHTFDTRI